MQIKFFRWCSLVLAGVAATLCSAEPADPSADAEPAVRELEAQLGQAVVRGDRAFFERVLAADFTHTSHAGAFKTKAQWMSERKFRDKGATPEPATTQYDAYVVDDLAVRVYGDTAVVTGRTRPSGRSVQGKAIAGRYRFLRVWVKRQGHWQAVAFQGTRIAEPD